MKRTVLVWGVALVLAGVGALAASASPTYVGVEKCKMCHRLQYNSWAQTKHAKATEDAKNSKERTFEAACLTCHATNKDEKMAGVQCEACHGPGSDYKSISIMKDKEKAIAAGLVIPTQKTCNGCHDGQDHHKKITFDRNIVHAHKS
jgi:Cytochrome c554 and c-prime